VCWFDVHEGLGVWIGSAASLFVGMVALALPFLLRWLDRVSKLQQISLNSFLAVHHARGALLLIMELQRYLYSLGQTPLNATNRQWEFELGVAQGTLEMAMKSEIRDPAVLPELVAVLGWTKMALGVLPLDGADGLFHMQYSTAAREKSAADLLRMQHTFLDNATRLLPRRA